MKIVQNYFPLFVQKYIDIYTFKQIVFSQTDLPVETVSEIVYKMLPDDYKIYKTCIAKLPSISH